MKVSLFVKPALILLVFCQCALAAGPESGTILSKEKAIAALKGIQGEVLSVTPAEIPGLFQVAMKMQGKVIPLYLDATGSYLFTGNIIRIEDRKNLTEEHFNALNPVDLSRIPVDDAILLGNAEADQQVMVFTDPHCPFCSKMHQVLLEAVAADSALAFQIKLIPFKQSSQKISQTIVCNKSLEQLELAFSGQALPESECTTSALEENLLLARELGITGTPTLILPNGIIAPGYRPLDDLLSLIRANAATP